MSEHVELIRDGSTARLRLTRPATHNALSAAMMDGVSAAVAELRQDDRIRVVVLEAEGKSFCAGGDLEWMRDQMRATPGQRQKEALRLAHMLRDLNSLPKPLVARVQGAVFGGGVGLCAVSDVVIAVETAQFGLTETRLGLIPATIGPYVLARIGQGAARRYFASAERFDAQVAARIGLVSEIVPATDLDAAVARQVSAYEATAPGAVAAAKRLALTDAPDEAAITASVAALMAQWEGGEAMEGTTAFFEKRKPAWTRT